jgi:hypothetical protein
VGWYIGYLSSLTTKLTSWFLFFDLYGQLREVNVVKVFFFVWVILNGEDNGDW